MFLLGTFFIFILYTLSNTGTHTLSYTGTHTLSLHRDTGSIHCLTQLHMIYILSYTGTQDLKTVLCMVRRSVHCLTQGHRINLGSKKLRVKRIICKKRIFTLSYKETQVLYTIHCLKQGHIIYTLFYTGTEDRYTVINRDRGFIHCITQGHRIYTLFVKGTFLIFILYTRSYTGTYHCLSQ